MSMNKPRDASKERFWRRIMRHWRRSGLSARAFCKELGLSEPSFYGWRRILKQRDATKVAFVPVRVVPEQKEVTDQQTSGSGLELVIGHGRVLRVGPAFDGLTLRRLLALLEESQP